MAPLFLPPIAPYPAIGIRTTLPPATWSTTLATYNTLLAHRLSLPPSALLADKTLHVFIASYFHELSHPPPSPPPSTPESKQLKRSTLHLLSRIFASPAGTKLPQGLITSQFLCSLAVSLPKSAAVKSTFDVLWANHHDSVGEPISNFKGTTILPQLLPGKNAIPAKETQTLLHNLSILFLASPRIGQVFITGSDFLDALIDLYTTNSATNPSLCKAILRVTHVAFISLLPSTNDSASRKPNYSLLLDHLYSLQSHKPGSKEHTFLTALISHTTLLYRLRSTANNADGPNPRLSTLISILEEKYTPSGKAPRPRKKHTTSSKGKEKATNDDTSLPPDLLTQYTLQVLEILPELSGSEPWVRARLAKLNGDVEPLVREYLDDKSYEQNTLPIATPISSQINHQGRRSPPHGPSMPTLSVRKNIHDNDELDTLSTNALSSLHIGKKDTAGQEFTGSDPVAKAAILAALAVFDMDDDERDDTYDIADVGGAVDTTGPESDPAPPSATTIPTASTSTNTAPQDASTPERILYTLWTTSTPPERASYFARDSATRRSNARSELKSKTGWGDEAIEGWGVMLERDITGRRMKELERRFGDGSQGNLNTGSIGRTRWRKPEDEEMDGDAGEGGGGGTWRGDYGYKGGRGSGGSGRGRGTGGRGGGAGAGVGGDTPRDRARKEANKSSRANHSRREGHARKMARGMGGPVG